MSRFSNLPAVGQYQARVPFDKQKSIEAIRNGIEQVAGICQPGAMQWVKDKQPELYFKCQTALAAMNQAFAKQVTALVIAAVEAFVRIHRQAFGLYNNPSLAL